MSRTTRQRSAERREDPATPDSDQREKRAAADDYAAGPGEVLQVVLLPSSRRSQSHKRRLRGSAEAHLSRRR